MDIQVEGSNNRVAGRDYYENKIKPCPRCEVRVIDREKSICNHCTKEERDEKARGQMTLFGLGVLFIFGWLHGWRSERGLAPGIEGLAETLALSVGIAIAALSVIWFLLPLVVEIGAAYFESRRNRYRE